MDSICFTALLTYPLLAAGRYMIYLGRTGPSDTRNSGVETGDTFCGVLSIILLGSNVYEKTMEADGRLMTPQAVATKIKAELAAKKIPFGAVLEKNRDDKKPENNTSKIYWTVKLHKLNNAGEHTFPARFIISGRFRPLN